MMDKNKLLILILIWLPLGCNYLDFDESGSINSKEDVYKYFQTTEYVLNDVYSYLPQDLGIIGGALRDCATDDAEFADVNARVQDFNNGSWSATNALDNQWSFFYSGIRAANGFLEEIEHVDFSRFEFDPGYKLMMTKLSYFPSEARALRAYFFFELAKRYGDIAMPTKVLLPAEANEITKTSFDEVIEFIVSECDQVIPELPVSYQDLTGQVGRVTKGFAMALKSRALLYAASALHNVNNDKGKWQRAAQAALDLIDSAESRGWYARELGVASDNNLSAREVIMFRLNGDNSNFERVNFPTRFTEGQTTTTGACPSQNLVDAFETSNGYPVILGDNGWESDDPAFNPETPYANRDPRLAKTVITNGATFKGVEIETYVEGKDGGAVAGGGTPTGYFLRKYIQPSTSFEPGAPVTNRHFWVIFRYGEILLNYAEAMTEAFDDPDYVDATFNRSALWALNEVRKTVPMPEVSANGKEEFLTRVRNERRVELAFEDHRFWDVRRWMIGDKTQTALYGVRIEKMEDGTFAYRRYLYETRAWSDRMNLYPIPQEELFKNQYLNPQNIGW